MQTETSLAFKRTGKITLRCEPYLIIRFPTGYTALAGLPGERSILGHYPDSEAAQRACESHRQKKPQAA